MDIEWAMSKVRGRRSRKGDAARLRELMRSIQAGSEKAGLLKGMTEEGVLRKLRHTRDAVWAETKRAAGTRH